MSVNRWLVIDIAYTQVLGEAGFNSAFKTVPVDSKQKEEFYAVVDDLDPTEDGEAGEESHGAADKAELGLQGHHDIFPYLVIGAWAKEYLE